MTSNWILCAVLSALFAGLVPILGKHGLANVDSTLATAVRSAVMTLFLLGVSGVTGKLSGISRLDRQALIAIGLSGLAGALSWLFYFMALRDGPTAGVVGLDRTSVVFAVLFAAVFLAEPISMRSALGTTLVLAGALLMAAK